MRVRVLDFVNNRWWNHLVDTGDSALGAALTSGKVDLREQFRN